MYYKKKKQLSRLSIITKVIITFAGILAGFIISRIFILPFTIDNNSMKPNLKKGDKILILKHITPERGDVILIRSPVETDKVILKRIISIGNDTIEIKNKMIYINNNKSRFKWQINTIDKRIFPMSFSYRDNMPPVKLEKNEYFILGDNIDYSFDSRTFGIINGNNIIGKMIYKF